MNATIHLSAIDNKLKQIIHAVQYDTARFLDCYIDDVDIGDITEARIYARKPDGTEVYNDAVVGTEYITVPLTSQTLAAVGQVECQLQLKVGDTLTTFEFIVIVDESLVSSSAIESSNEYTALEDALNRVEDVEAGLPSKEDKANKVTELSEDSTDIEYPSAKCVYDAISSIEPMEVDDALSDTSTNPVQNKVITETLQNLATDIETEFDGKVSKSGDTISGLIQFGGTGSGITFLATSRNPAIICGGKRIAQVGNPTVVTDAVNKRYVDDLVGDINTILATLATI